MLKNSRHNRILRIVSGIIAVILMGVIFFFSAQPGTASDEVSIGFTQMLFGGEYNVAAILNCFVREVAHVAEYGALALPVYLFILTFLKNGFLRWFYSLIFCALYSVTDEIHQLFVPGRACEFIDICEDSLGALLCVTIMAFIVKAVVSRSSKDNSSELTSADALVLDSFSAFIKQENINIDINVSTVDLFIKKSADHKILPMTGSAVINSVNVSDNIRLSLKNEIISQVALQSEKTEAFIDVYKEMLSFGAKPLCIKGIICRSLYPGEDLRISSDEDLLVTESDFKICSDLLIKDGYKPDKENDSFEVGFINSKTGSYIELHRSLFPDDGGVYSAFNSALSGIFNDTDKIIINDTVIYTPDSTLNLLYLILHAFKHFINCGVGIRQIADISLFASSFNPDWEFIFAECKNLSLTEFLSAVLLIGSKYFGLDISKIQCDNFIRNIDYFPLLADIMSGGVYGSRNINKRHSASVTFEKYSSGLTGKKNSYIRSIFPDKDTMQKKYSYLIKHSGLLPFAYIHRIFRYLFTEKDTDDTIINADKRSELMEKYNIF